MKTMIAYYSRTGFTRRIAEELGKTMGADIEEVCESKSRAGFIAYIGATLDVVFGRDAEIAESTLNPSDYDLVIIGTPVWAARPVPAIQTHIKAHADKLPKTACLCTLGGSGSEKTFVLVESLIGKACLAQLALTDEQIKSGAYRGPLKEFAEQMKAEASLSDV